MQAARHRSSDRHEKTSNPLAAPSELMQHQPTQPEPADFDPDAPAGARPEAAHVDTTRTVTRPEVSTGASLPLHPQ